MTAPLGKHKLDRALDGAIRRLQGAPCLTPETFTDEVMKTLDPSVVREDVKERAAFVLRELFDPAAVIEELCAKDSLSANDVIRLKSAEARLAEGAEK